MISNARMYAVTPQVEVLWCGLLERICAMARVHMEYLSYPAPQLLEPLWRRADVGAVFMCGYPIRLKIAGVQPLAAPVPDVDWAKGRAVYRTDFIVRADSSYRTLAETFFGHFGWTVAHSHSGFNAPRHHLLRYLTAGQEHLFKEVSGNLITAREILDRVADGRLDVGPLDAYWHHLLRLHRPELLENIRVIENTDVAPMPCFVAGKSMTAAEIARLKAAFTAVGEQDWFSDYAGPLAISGFLPVDFSTYQPLQDWQDEALAANYAEPG